jgi:hypothetical protein
MPSLSVNINKEKDDLEVESLVETTITPTSSPTPVKELSLKEKILCNPNIKLFDKDENNLELYCYLSCTNDDDTEIKNSRGIIFDGDQLVIQAFAYTDEYNCDVNVTRFSHIDFSQCLFYDAYEGSLIRVFYYKTKWYISTHKKLDAFRSKWASKESFGDLFQQAIKYRLQKDGDPRSSDEILKDFLGTLDKNNQYMFLLRNTKENCIVCRSTNEPLVFHVGTFLPQENNKLTMELDVNIPYPTKLSFASFDELLNYVDSIDIEDKQGVIVFTPNNQQYKIVNNVYQEYFQVRGNEPSIKFRYLQLRMDKTMCNKLAFLYPSFIEKFEYYENTIFDVAQTIYNNYCKRFIKKLYIVVPKEEFEIMRKVHNYYLADKTNNRVDLDYVIDCLNDLHPTLLNHLIRQFEQAKKQKSNPKNEPYKKLLHTKPENALSEKLKREKETKEKADLLLEFVEQNGRIPQRKTENGLKIGDIWTKMKG